MTMAEAVRWDMFDRDIYASPYETFRRLRNESPVYYNEEYNFYALSRHEDLGKVLTDRETFISGKGMVYNIISNDVEMPAGLFINEDPPMHTMHRSIVSRLFTPRAVASLEHEIRALSEEIVDGLEGRDQFDFMRDFALRLPVQVIGMLVGVPKKDQADLLAVFQKSLHEGSVDPDRQLMQGILDSAAWFNEYLDWREKHPTDDVMTQLMNFEFKDETGGTRTLRREEIVTYLTLITTAGSDTTATGISWAGSLLNDHPDQRRELAEDRSLIPRAFEEVLRPRITSAAGRPRMWRCTARRFPLRASSFCSRALRTGTKRSGRTRSNSTSTVIRPRYSRSVSAPTSASARTSQRSRLESLWRRFCRGTPSGASTTTTPYTPRESTPVDGNPCLSPLAEHRQPASRAVLGGCSHSVLSVTCCSADTDPRRVQ